MLCYDRCSGGAVGTVDPEQDGRAGQGYLSASADFIRFFVLF